MTPLRNQFLWVLGGLLLGSPLAWGDGTPALGTVSQWGGAQVSWEISDQHVVGRLSGPFGCPFIASAPVLEGDFEGTVLVGQVLLCQTGNGCPPTRKYPFFGFFNHANGTLTADIRLDRGCHSPVLQEGRLQLVTKREEAARHPASVHGPSITHTAEGKRSLDRGDLTRAMAEFRAALDGSEDRAVVLVGMGEVEMRRNRPKDALADYRGALSMREDGDTYYNIACAQARLKDRSGALQSLRRAVKLGFLSGQHMARDPDLAELRTEPTFQALVKQAQPGAHLDKRHAP